MKLRVLCVGSRAPEWVRTGFAHYAKRLPKQLRLTLIEIPAAPRGRGPPEEARAAEA